jgi:hypothetical protein
MDNDKKYQIGQLRYWRGRRYASLKKLDVPVGILKNNETLLNKTIKEWKKEGFTEDDWKAFVDKYYLHFENIEMEEQLRESCVVFLKHIQKVDGDNMELSPCVKKNKSCTLCKDRIKATEEQIANVMHGCDIETGKPLDNE